MTKINQPVPEFSAEAFHNGEFKTITSDDVRGKWSIFLFYQPFIPASTWSVRFESTNIAILKNDRTLTLYDQNGAEHILCALMFLLNRQARSPGLSLAAPIRKHLVWLIENPRNRASTCVARDLSPVVVALASRWPGYGRRRRAVRIGGRDRSALTEFAGRR